MCIERYADYVLLPNWVASSIVSKSCQHFSFQLGKFNIIIIKFTAVSLVYDNVAPEDMHTVHRRFLDSFPTPSPSLPHSFSFIFHIFGE